MLKQKDSNLLLFLTLILMDNHQLSHVMILLQMEEALGWMFCLVRVLKMYLRAAMVTMLKCTVLWGMWLLSM